MIRDELQLMFELKEKFEKRASEVADILSGLKYLDGYNIKWDFVATYDFRGFIEYIEDASDFWLCDDNRVTWEGNGGYRGSFPVDYLFKSNKSLRKFVNRVNLENQKKLDKIQKQKEADKLKEERRLYEQLKAKFENESKD